MRIDFNLVFVFFFVFVNSNSKDPLKMWNEAQHCAYVQGIWISIWYEMLKNQKAHTHTHTETNTRIRIEIRTDIEEQTHTWSTTRLHNSNSLTMHLNSFINSKRTMNNAYDDSGGSVDDGDGMVLPLFFGEHNVVDLILLLAFGHVSNSKLYTLWIY